MNYQTWHIPANYTDAGRLLLPIERRSLGAIYNMLASERFGRISELIAALPPGHPAKAPFDLIKETPVQNRANIVMGLGNRLPQGDSLLQGTADR